MSRLPSTLAVVVGGSDIVSQLATIAIALVLTTVIGIEREFRARSAGLRTLTLVGIGTVLFTLVSQHGFRPADSQTLGSDPSRVAAQIVSGIGFLGGGLIFVKQDAVRGLTTAATVWLTAAVAMAVGAGLYIAAIAVTVAHLSVVSLYPPLARWIPISSGTPRILHITYIDGQGLLRRILAEATARRYTIDEVREVERWVGPSIPSDARRVRTLQATDAEAVAQVTVTLALSGNRSSHDLTNALADFEGVIGIRADDAVTE